MVTAVLMEEWVLAGLYVENVLVNLEHGIRYNPCHGHSFTHGGGGAVWSVCGECAGQLGAWNQV